ncbi:hypothetical protein [Helicobacter sp. 13S00477-4]|uniref:hypothetical protein n=1 Tax=Helicobacter sp. 13S00477-4 TaxID=1905759 RepID=UPI000BA79D93|nr:hypothetical protein [Helicobacter sp. 13S00477-4]PAF52006.1 hypothetical protein BKH44_04930 [Helicobacter sp. 13S00477-4]
MPKLDKLKEQVSLLKFWLGLIVVALFSDIGWIFINLFKATYWQLIIAFTITLPIILGIIVLSMKINKKLNQIEKE